MAKMVTLADGLAAGYCGRGVLQAAREVGLDWRKLTREGIPLEEWRQIEDAQFTRVGDVAEAREDRDG